MTKPQPPPPTPDPAATIRRALVAQYIKKAAVGQNLKPDEWRLLLDDAQRDQHWPDRKSCADDLAKELGRVVGTRGLYELKRQGAPIPTRGPINKLAVWKWLAIEKREKGRPGEQGPAAPLREQKLEKEVAILSAKLANLQGSMLDAELARAIVVAAAEHIRNTLRNELPAKSVEFAQSLGVIEATEAIKIHIDQILNDLSSASERFAPRGGQR